MSEDSNVYLEDILNSTKKIFEYTQGMDFHSFLKNNLVSDAVIRNLLVIGEAAKHIPAEIRKKHPEIEWKKMAGLRDTLVHGYAGISLTIVWDVVENKLPELEKAIKQILKEKI